MDEETTRLVDRMKEAKESAWSSMKWNRVLFTLLTILNIAAGAVMAALSGATFAGFLGENVLAISSGIAGIVAFLASSVLNAFRIKDATVDAARAAAEVESIIELLLGGSLSTQAASRQYAGTILKYADTLGGYSLR